jgi:hypothetical protein
VAKNSKNVLAFAKSLTLISPEMVWFTPRSEELHDKSGSHRYCSKNASGAEQNIEMYTVIYLTLIL